MRRGIAILVGLGLLIVVTPLGVSITGTNVAVKYYTDSGSWTSGGTTVDDTTTSFSGLDRIIQLDTVTDAFLSTSGSGSPCTVTVTQNGQLQATLSCSVPGQRVVFTYTGDSFALGQITPAALAGYGELFLASPNSQVTYRHVVYNAANNYIFRNVTQVSAVNTTFADTALPFTASPCPSGNHIHGNMRVSTADGFSEEHDYHFGTCT